MASGVDATRPDDGDLLRSTLRGLAGSAGIPVLFAGLVDAKALTITELFGTRTHSLRRLWVQPGEGVGGGAIATARPTMVADYLTSPQISHHHDEAVRPEGLRSMAAAPVMVEGRPRAVIYAATRGVSALGERAAVDMLRCARAVAEELRVRDEVDRRLAILRSAEPEESRLDRDVRESVRVALGELVALAGTTDDPELAAGILRITDRLTGRAPEAAPLDAPALTRRESDVLTQVALGCTYPETARRLGLRPDTVKGYMQQTMQKLGVHSRHEAVATARRLGLLP